MFETPRWERLLNWRGIRNRRVNALDYPPDALFRGENLDIVDGSLRTRAGARFVDDQTLPVGEVRFLEQVRFPTNLSNYLIAQVDTELWISTTRLPSDSISWQLLYQLGAEAGRCSIAVLNDRAVIVEDNHCCRPLVFLGCLSSDGSDWAVPRVMMISYDGENFHDITTPISDKDVDTFYDLGGLTTAGEIVVCLDAPACAGFLFELGLGNTNPAVLSVEYRSGGAWVPVSNLSDGTDNGGASFGQSGIVSWDEVESDYWALYQVPGFWFRLKWDADLSSNCEMQRTVFDGKPCQELQVIGDGQSDLPMVFMYSDISENITADYTVEVSDNTIPSVAWLNDRPETGEPVGMGVEDAFYVGYLVTFNATELTLHPSYNNDQPAALSASYWNGSEWTPLTITDGTEEGGVTLAKKGLVSWTTPEDWRDLRLNNVWPPGKYIRFEVNATLRAKTAISECRVYPDEEQLAKHKFAVTFRDRIVLLNRPDAPDQLTISRRLEEYGWTGQDSASLRVGGQDEIVGAAAAFNQVFTGKTEAWYLLNGYNAATFASERAETGGQTPINDHTIISAPYTDVDGKNKQCLAFLNQFGAWVFTGLQAVCLSLDVNWWNADGDNPRIDLNNLWKASGIFLPSRNWLIWSVPMIVGSDTEQTECNRLICYDLTTKAWQPPATLSVASLCAAYGFSDGAPGNRGTILLLGGDTNGRIVRLFDGTDDFGSAITAWGETGWLHFGTPELVKDVSALVVYGKGDDLTLEGYLNGSQIVSMSESLDQLAGRAEEFWYHSARANGFSGRLLKFRFTLTGPGSIKCLSLMISGERDWLAM